MRRMSWSLAGILLVTLIGVGFTGLLAHAADPSITVSNVEGNTGEDGTAVTFTVVLGSEPTATVTIGLSSSDTTEGTVSPTSLSFDAGDWDVPKIVTVTGVDDDEDDGNIIYTIITAPAVGGDYTGIDPDDVSVNNVDDEIPGVTVTPTSGLTTTEAGGTDSFTVVLDTEPTAEVTITISSSDETEGTVAPALLTFDSMTWDIPQTVVVTGVDDGLGDGDMVYTILTGQAQGGDYTGADTSDVSVTNVDDDSPGVTVDPTSGLITTEAGGADTFTVVLRTQPGELGFIGLGISTSDATEGTVSPTSLWFNQSNWHTPQTVTVTGVDDGSQDGDIAFTIVTSVTILGDSSYSGVVIDTVSVTNVDDEVPGISVTAISGPTSEAGGTATFTISADTAPSADVTVPLSSSNMDEGTVPASVVLPAGSTSAVTVTVTGVDDDIDDGDIGYTIVTGDPVSQGDADYEALGADDVADVSVTNQDDDTAGVTVTPTSGLTTTEAGGTATFTVVLDSEPVLGDCGDTPAVIILVQSDDTTEGTVSPSTLIFMVNQWDVPQTVTITGADDAILDGTVGYTIVVQPAAGCGYDGIDGDDVSVTNTDDDVPGVTVSTISGNTSEDGTTATFTVVLNCEPGDSVTIDLLSDNLAEGTIDLDSLTFMPGNWNVPQTITVTGVDDSSVDGDIGFTIVLSPAVSTDGGFSGIDPNDVAVVNEDDDNTVIVPTGDAGFGAFLDEVLPVIEGEIQPMAGDLPLTAIHAVGDVITGSCQILSAMGTPTCAGHIRVFLYAVDIATVPEATALLARWSADYSWDTHEFRIVLDTTGFAPGHYDLCLSFEGGLREVFRIELVPPAE